MATSDKGVILIRKIILNAIRAVQEKRAPKGALRREQAHEMVEIDSFTGVRAKGNKLTCDLARFSSCFRQRYSSFN